MQLQVQNDGRPKEDVHFSAEQYCKVKAVRSVNFNEIYHQTHPHESQKKYGRSLEIHFSHHHNVCKQNSKENKVKVVEKNKPSSF